MRELYYGGDYEVTVHGYESSVAAIDPSMAATAVCAGTPTDWSMETFKSKAHKPDVAKRIERWQKLADQVVTFTAKHRPHLILIEGYSFASNGRLHEIGEFGAILRVGLLFIANVVEVPPSSLKKFATGKGNANKAAVVSAVTKRYGIGLGSDDEADAVALWHIGLCLSGKESPANKSQQEVVDKLQEGLDS